MYHHHIINHQEKLNKLTTVSSVLVIFPLWIFKFPKNHDRKIAKEKPIWKLSFTASNISPLELERGWVQLTMKLGLGDLHKKTLKITYWRNSLSAIRFRAFWLVKKSAWHAARIRSWCFDKQTQFVCSILMELGLKHCFILACLSRRYTSYEWEWRMECRYLFREFLCYARRLGIQSWVNWGKR